MKKRLRLSVCGRQPLQHFLDIVGDDADFVERVEHVDADVVAGLPVEGAALLELLRDKGAQLLGRLALEQGTLAAAHGEALQFLRGQNDVRWTYISPAADFQPDRAKSGRYILAGEELTLSPKGESVIGYEDYAAAFVDELEKGSHVGERISVVEG